MHSPPPKFVQNARLISRHDGHNFDVSFPEKLLKIVATRGEIFSLKFTKYRLAAGLCPDPLGELKRSPNPLAAIGGGLLLRRGKGIGGEGRGGKGKWRGNLFQGVGVDAPERWAWRIDDIY